MGAPFPVRRIAKTLALASVATLGLALQLHLIDLVGSTGSSLRALEFVLDAQPAATRTPRQARPQRAAAKATLVHPQPLISREIAPAVTVLTRDDERALRRGEALAVNLRVSFAEGVGIHIGSVPPASFAERVGLEAGDIVWIIDGRPVSTVDEARAAAIALRASRSPVIRVGIMRRGELRHFYVVRPVDDRAGPRRGEAST